uniref:Cilia- and flagella-associated protein 36 n=1 Tax=Panagrellus redivivus TaxID=6233 RepID=A0A7E4WC64_PANRE
MFRRRSNSTPKRPATKTVFKKFMDFLQSSIWQLPTGMFMEQHSVVFDRDQLDPALFKKIHTHFVNLIDMLINAYCEDTKITPEDLVAALKSVDQSKQLTSKERILLEPVVAAQDFNVFVPMMMRKNVELQLQALKLMHHISGMIPTAMTFEDEDAILWELLKDEEECERVVLISVIRKSREDYVNESDITFIQPGEEQHVSEEEMILKSIQEQHNQGLDEAIRKNLQDGLESLILKKPKTPAPKTITASSAATVSASASDSSRNGTKNDKAVSGAGVSMAGASSTQILKIGGDKPGSRDGSGQTGTDGSKADKEKHVAASAQGASRPSSKRSKSASRPMTSKNKDKDAQKDASKENKSTKDKEKAPMDPAPTPFVGETITAVPEKAPTRSGTASRKERRRSTTVLVPGMPEADKKRASISGFSNASGTSSKASSPNPAINALNNGFDYRSLLKEREHISEEEIKRRAAYLRQQRDKLLQMKQEEQQKQLQEQTSKGSLERPKTAQAARNAMTQSRMESRKAVASKLRVEVIDPAGASNTPSTSAATDKQSS